MEALVILLVLGWLVSPVVLFIICMVQRGRINELKRRLGDIESGRFNMNNMQGYQNPNAPYGGYNPPQNPAYGQNPPPVQSVNRPPVRPVTEYQQPMNPPDGHPAVNTAVNDSAVIRQSNAVNTSVPSSAIREDIPVQNTQGTVYQQNQAVRNGSVPVGNYHTQNDNSGMGRDPYSAAYVQPEKKKTHSTVNIVLILGAMFIILAGFVFSAATWGIMNSFFKSVVLLSFSAFFYGLHILSAKKLKLEKAGKVFFVLGSVFLPAAVAAGAALNVFGDFLSFKGDGKMLVFALMSALLSGAFIVGTCIYGLKSYARTAYLSLAAVFGFLLLYSNNVVMSLIMAVISLAAVLGEPYLKKNMRGALADELGVFTTVNVWLPAIIALFISESGGLLVAASVIFSASFFAKALRKENPASAVFPFCTYLLISTMIGFRPDGFGEYELIATGVIIVFTLLGMLGAVPQAVKKCLETAAAVFSGLVILCGICIFLFEKAAMTFSTGNGYSVSALISAVAMLIQLIVLSVRTRNEIYRILIAPAVCWALSELSMLLYTETSLGSYVYLIVSVILLAYFIAAKLTAIKDMIGHISTDAFVIIALLPLVFIHPLEETGAAVGFVQCAFLIAAAFISGKDNITGRISLPFAVITTAYPLMFADAVKNLSAGSDNEAVFAFTVLIFCAAAVITLIKPLRKFSPYMSCFVPLFFLIHLAAFFDRTDSIQLLASASILVYTLANLIAHRDDKRILAYSSAFLSMMCFVCFETAFVTSDSNISSVVFPAVLLMALFGIAIMPQLENTKISENMIPFLWIVMPLYSVLTGAASASAVYFPALVCSYILFACGCGLGVIRKNTIPSAVSAVVIFITTMGYLSEDNMGTAGLAVMIVLTVVFSAAGRIVFGREKREGLSFDMLSSAAVFGPLSLLAGDCEFTKYDTWLSFILAGIIALNFIRKTNSDTVNRIAASAAAFMIIPLWWVQPFFTVPEIVETELLILPVALFCAMLMRIYRDKPEPVGTFCYAVAILCLLILFISAVQTGYAADAVMLGGVIVFVLLISFALKRRRWFMLSAASAAAEALALTLRLWNSRTWWIYLLAAGVILILLGMKNEKNKQNRDKEKEKTGLSKVISDWEW